MIWHLFPRKGDQTTPQSTEEMQRLRETIMSAIVGGTRSLPGIYLPPANPGEWSTTTVTTKPRRRPWRNGFRRKEPA